MKELTPGLELGARFVLIRRLGRGGTAEVWLADDRERGEPVALKLLDDEGGAQSFSAPETVRTPNSLREFAVPVHDVLQVAGRTLVVMEHLEGGDLGQFRGRSFESWSRAADDVAASLAAFHAAGLVHRDLKCGNVQIGRAHV